MMRKTLSLIMILGLFLLSFGTVAATTRTVEDSYSAEDTLSPGEEEEDNRYFVTVEDGKEISYSVKIAGNGTGNFRVYFVQGHTRDANFTYYELHSRDEDTTSHSEDAFTAPEDEEKYTIIVKTDSVDEISYKIEIEITDTPLWKWIVGGSCVLLIVVGLVFRVLRR